MVFIGVYRCVAEKLNARFMSVLRKKWLSCAASRARTKQRSVQNARRDIIVKVHAERALTCVVAIGTPVARCTDNN